jgi:hypothetical protein
VADVVRRAREFRDAHRRYQRSLKEMSYVLDALDGRDPKWRDVAVVAQEDGRARGWWQKA